MQLNNGDYTNWGNLGEAAYLAGDHPQAIESYRKAIILARLELKVNPYDIQLLRDLANYYAMTNDRRNALRYLNEALEQSKFSKESLFKAALVYKDLGEVGPAIEWFRKALQAGYPRDALQTSPDLDNLRGDKRFQDLLKSSNSGPNPGK